MDARTNPVDPRDFTPGGNLIDDNQIIRESQAELGLPERDITPGGVNDAASTKKADASAKKDDAKDNDEDDPGAIRQDIAQTRNEMSGTIDAIQERLSPQRIVSDATDSVKAATIGKVQDMASNVRDSASDAGNTVIDTIRQNPIPALMAGLGLGWLVYKVANNPSRQAQRNWQHAYNRMQPNDSYGYGPSSSQYYYGEPQGMSQTSGTSPSITDRASQTAGKIQDKAGDMADQVQTKVGQLTDQVQDRASDMGDQMQQQAYQARDWLQETWQDNPLLLSAGTVLVGLTVGLLIKETPQENKMMGQARDNLMDKAQDVAQDTSQKVQKVAQHAADAAKDEAQNQGLVGQQNQATQSQSHI